MFFDDFLRTLTNLDDFLETCMHACMHAWMHVWMHAWMYAWMHAPMHASMRACMDDHMQSLAKLELYLFKLGFELDRPTVGS